MQNLSFKIPALGSAGEMEVYEFAGEEALSQLFTFDVVAGSVDAPLALEDIVRQKVQLTLEVSSEESGHEVRDFYGIITAVTDWGEAHGDRYLFFYRMTVKPLFWLMTLHKRSRVFRSSTVPDIIKLVLEDNGFTGNDFRFDLRTDYPVRDFTVQFEEPDWNLVCRLAEDEGIFFHFIPEGDREVIVFTDYNPEEGGPLDIGEVMLLPRISLNTDLVHLANFTGRSRMTPDIIRCLDRDYEDYPTGTSLKETPTNEDSADRYGIFEEYDELVRAVRTQTGWSGEAADVENEIIQDRDDRLALRAERRKEEILANDGTHYFGTSNQSLFGHGNVFALTNSERYDGKYLILRSRHVGSYQSQFMGLTFENMSMESFGEAFHQLFQTLQSSDDAPEGSRAGGYANGITCIELARPYRPARNTPVPRIPSVVAAKIEAFPGDKLLDKEGRYLMRMFFDEHGDFKSEENQASRPVRRMQISGGKDWGSHLPSECGTESLIAFLNGNPDEPVALGNLPNMATHSPVPNTSLGLGSENPDEQTWSDENTRISYDEKKHVVRTQVGHQMVMDDDSGTANVGVTIQAGKTPAEQEGGETPDVYWGSKGEYGGHRAKGAVEQDLDSKTQGIDGLGDDASVPGALSGIVQNATTDKDYWEDASSSVTPVGVHLFTNNRVELVGKNGLDLHAPNLANPSGGQGPQNLDVDQNRGLAMTIAKFLNNALWRGVFKRLKDYIDNGIGTKSYSGDHDADPILTDPTDHATSKLEKNLETKAYKALRLPGIRLNAAGPLTMTSYTSVDAVTGKGGFNVDSFGDVRQRADLDATMEAGQMITIRTTGKKLESPPLDDAADALKGTLGDSGALAGEALSKASETIEQVFEEEPSIDYFPILLQNENSGIILHTEGQGGSDDKGHIDLYAEGEGDVRARSREGKIAAHSTKEIILKVETESNEALSNFYDGEMFDESIMGSKIVMNPTKVETYADDFIRLQTFMDDKGNDMAPSIQIDKNQTITLQCGMSMIKLSSDGTIDIEGITINLKAEMTINEEAQLQLNEKAMMIESKADAMHKTQSPMVDIKGDAMIKAQGGIVMIN